MEHMQKKIERLKTRLYNLLRWSEKYTKTDMNYLAQGGFWLSLSNGMSTVLKLGLLVAFANFLDPDVFGNYQFILSLAAVVGAFTLSGMRAAIIQAVSRGFQGALKFGALTHLKWSVGIVLAASAIATYYFINENTTLAISMLIVGTFLPFLESAKLYRAFLNGTKQFKYIFLFGLPGKFLPFITMIVLLLVTEDPVILVLGYFASNTFAAGIAYFWTLRTCEPTNETDPNTLGFSKHLSVMNVISTVAANLDKILIFHYVGAAELAIYALARSPVQQFNTLLQPLNTLAFPKLSNQSLSVLKKTLPIKTAMLFFLLLGIALTYIFLAPFVFQIFFPQYLDSIILSQILALTLLFIPFKFYKQALNAHMKKRELYILSLSEQCVRIGFLLILLPFYGVWGAIATIFLTRTLIGGTTIFLFLRAK